MLSRSQYVGTITLRLQLRLAGISFPRYNQLVMRPAAHLLPWRWPAWCWLLGLGVVLTVRFPIHYVLYPPYLMDFDVYRAVAMRVLQGQGEALYLPTTSDAMLFKYGPIWAVLFGPLAWMPARPGAILWSFLTVLWVVGSCHYSLKLARHAQMPAPPWLLPIAIVVLVRPVTAEFLNGQVDMLWALLVLAALVAETEHRIAWAAVWLALAMSLKIPAAVIWAGWLLAGKRAPALLAAGLMGLLNVLAATALAPHQPLTLFGQWGRTLISSGASRAFEIGNQSIYALASRFLSADGYHLNVLALPAPAAVAVAIAVSCGLFALVILWSRRRDTGLDGARQGAMLMVLMVLCSPTVWIATYSALLFPCVLLLAGLVAIVRSRRCDLSLAVLSLCIALLSAMTHSALWRSIGLRHFRGESYVFLVLMVLPWLGVSVFLALWRLMRALPPRSASS